MKSSVQNLFHGFKKLVWYKNIEKAFLNQQR